MDVDAYVVMTDRPGPARRFFRFTPLPLGGGGEGDTPRITSLVLLRGGCSVLTPRLPPRPAAPLAAPLNASFSAAAGGPVTLEFLRPVEADGFRLRAASGAAGARGGPSGAAARAARGGGRCGHALFVGPCVRACVRACVHAWVGASGGGRVARLDL